MPKKAVIKFLAICCFVVIPRVLCASDHADPIGLNEPEAGLTGLFVFPKGNDLVVILGTRRGLTAAPPYDLEPYEFTIHMDLDANVSFTDAERRARYGGHLVNSEEITEDVTLTLQLNDDASLASRSFSGLEETTDIRVWTGVRDDPFIFPPFFRTNIIAMALAIPKSAFPRGQQDWVIWGTTSYQDSGKQIDHVGRANRTQLARFDFLNTLPPDQHVEAIEQRREKGYGIERFLMRFIMPATGLYQYLFEIRPYDVEPDVMIYTTRSPPGFPNGRRLSDDVAALICEHGDCILQELSYVHDETWPRKTTNDKPFLKAFPYFASPWPERPQSPMESHISWAWILTIAGLILLTILGGIIWVFRRLRAK